MGKSNAFGGSRSKGRKDEKKDRKKKEKVKGGKVKKTDADKSSSKLRIAGPTVIPQIKENPLKKIVTAPVSDYVPGALSAALGLDPQPQPSHAVVDDVIGTAVLTARVEQPEESRSSDDGDDDESMEVAPSSHKKKDKKKKTTVVEAAEEDDSYSEMSFSEDDGVEDDEPVVEQKKGKKEKKSKDGDSTAASSKEDGDEPWMQSSTIIKSAEERKLELSSIASDKASGDQTSANTLANAKRDRTQQRENRKKKTSAVAATDDVNKRTVFVSNVDVETSEKDVKKLFKQCGAIESMRIRGTIPAKINLTKSVAQLSGKIHPRQKTVYYYIKFKEEASVKEALKLNGTQHWDHRLRVDVVTENKREYDRKSTIFIGNVAFPATEDGIAEHFEQLVGNVTFVRIVRDERGLTKGFAFVGFEDSASVALALSLPTIEFMSRELRISPVLKKNKLARTLTRPAANQKQNQNKNRDRHQPQVKKQRTGPKQKTVHDRNAPLKKSVRKAIKKRRESKEGKKSLMK